MWTSRPNIDQHRLLMTTPIEEVFQTECYVKDFVKGTISPEEIYEDPAPLEESSPNGSNLVHDNLVKNQSTLKMRRRKKDAKRRKYKDRYNTVRHIKHPRGVEEDADV